MEFEYGLTIPGMNEVTCVEQALAGNMVYGLAQYPLPPENEKLIDVSFPV
jgi:hypothetical protein